MSNTHAHTRSPLYFLGGSLCHFIYILYIFFSPFYLYITIMRLRNTDRILLLALSLILLCLQSVQANTEKLIFVASSSDNQEQECIHDRHDETGYVLKPPYSTIQRALIPSTPNTTITSSLSQHWYTLDELQTDMNYEVRISYPATVNITLNNSITSTPRPCTILVSNTKYFLFVLFLYM